MKEPWTCIIGDKSNGDVIDADSAANGRTHVHNVAANRVGVVVGETTCAPNDAECMLYQPISLEQVTNISPLTYSVKMEGMRATKCDR